ncbi:MAG: hypothetical protein V4773_30925 [Verrucomicrobiota bacterium]
MTPVRRTEIFNHLSSRLCGVVVSDGLKLLDFLILQVGEGPVDTLLGKYAELCGRGSQIQAVEALLDDEEQGKLCRSIMKLRLLGTWHPPEKPSTPANPCRPTKLASPEAFTGALCWKIMQAHAPGLAGPMDGPAYWGEEPPKLASFVTLLPDAADFPLPK